VRQEGGGDLPQKLTSSTAGLLRHRIEALQQCR
jgi:hypothetical protein